MVPRLLLDTHIVVRWLVDDRRLSRDQRRVLERAVRRAEPVGLSAITLVEIAVLTGGTKAALKTSLAGFIEDLQANPIFHVFPLTYEIALEVASLGVLKDPADLTIVATARVHRLQLVSSDLRIIQSKLAQVVE
jgi:PIN domain nuclease of toxin-antitoxin system